MTEIDHGKHYRYTYRVNLTQDDINNGYVDVKLDPFRICAVYRVNDFALQTIVKKTLCAGDRGYKDFEQDLLDIICAAQRRIEMLHEDQGKPEPKPECSDRSTERRLEFLEGQLNLIHGTLDNFGVPRSDNISEFTLWGRIGEYAETYSAKALLYKEILNLLGVKSYDAAVTQIKILGGGYKPETPWIKNTGVKPDCEIVRVKNKRGQQFTANIDNHKHLLNWDDTSSRLFVEEYQILE